MIEKAVWLILVDNRFHVGAIATGIIGSAVKPYHI